MRRKVTLSLDERFIQAMDDERGLVPRSRWIEAQRSPLTAAGKPYEDMGGREAAEALRNPPAPKARRSPAPRYDIGPVIEDMYGGPVMKRSKPPLQRPIVQKKDR